VRLRRPLIHTAKAIVFLFVFNTFVIPQLAGARRALDLIGQVNPVLVGAALVAELSSIVAYALLTRSALPLEPRLRVERLLRIQLSTKVVTNLVPGGTAPASALGYRLLVASGVQGADAGFAMATAGIGSAVVLNLLLWLALLVSIPLFGFNPLYATAALIGVVLLGTFAGLVALLRMRRERGDRIVQAVARRLPFVKEEPAVALVRRLAERIDELASSRVILVRAVAWASANWLLDALCLYFFLWAFGGRPTVIGLLVPYCLANVMAAIPITPGGLGIMEATLISTLVGFGLDPGVAALGVSAYRLVSFWLPIPLGALAYGSLRVGGPIRDVVRSAGQAAGATSAGEASGAAG